MAEEAPQMTRITEAAKQPTRLAAIIVRGFKTFETKIPDNRPAMNPPL